MRNIFIEPTAPYLTIIVKLIMEAVVVFEGAEAKYRITPENEEKQIYQASLQEYKGGDLFSPPKMLILIKGGDKWWGGAEDATIIETLGRAIDQNTQTEEMN